MGWGPFDLSGKAAIVTGGAMGIGFGIAERFVEGGAGVLLADVDEKAVHTAAAKLGKPERVGAMAVDVSRDDSGERMVARCVEKFGKVDVLLNVAGIFPSAPFMTMPVDLADRVWRINFRGLALASRAAAAQMIKQGHGGRIVNISSIDSLHPSMVGLVAYDSSKGAVNMFTKSFALEVAPHGITVNAIAPGAFPTAAEEIHPDREAYQRFVVEHQSVKRRGRPEDVAAAVLFFAGEQSGFITGQLIAVDGGWIMH